MTQPRSLKVRLIWLGAGIGALALLMPIAWLLYVNYQFDEEQRVLAALPTGEVRYTSAGSTRGEYIFSYNALKRVRELVLDHQDLTDVDLSNIRRLTHLETLSLTHTRLRNQDLRRLQLPDATNSLFLENNKFTEASMSTLAQLTGVEYLFLDDNEITDEGVAQLVKHPRLLTLGLTRTRVTDNVVNTLIEMRSLKGVH